MSGSLVTKNFDAQQERLIVTYAAFDAQQYGLPSQHRRIQPNPYPVWDGTLPLSEGRQFLWTHPVTLQAQPLSRRYPLGHWVVLNRQRQLAGLWQVKFAPRHDLSILMPYSVELGAVLYGAWNWLETHPQGHHLPFLDWLTPRLRDLVLLDVKVTPQSSGFIS